MILLPGLMAGMGLRSITDSSQAMKWGAINRTRAVAGPAEEAMRDMMDRYAAHSSVSTGPHRMLLPVATRASRSLDYIRSLVAWASRMGVGITSRMEYPRVPGTLVLAQAELRRKQIHSIYSSLQLGDHCRTYCTVPNRALERPDRQRSGWHLTNPLLCRYNSHTNLRKSRRHLLT